MLRLDLLRLLLPTIVALEGDIALDLKAALRSNETLWAALGAALQLPQLQELELEVESEEQLAESLQQVAVALA